MDQPTVFILNGPSMNLLGTREPELYGRETLADIETACRRAGEALGLGIVFRQSNHEGVLIDWIHEARQAAAGLVINAGGYSYTSVALLDAVKAVGLPAVEVHVTNVHARESFRHNSFLAPAVTGVISGFGGQSYVLAIAAMAHLLRARSEA